MSRTLADLNLARTDVEQMISETVVVKAITLTQRAERSERLATLHVRLSILLAETEMAAYRECPDMANVLRWAVRGADNEATRLTTAARKDREEDARTVVAQGGQIR